MGNCMPYMVLLKNNDARYGYQKGGLRKSCPYRINKVSVNGFKLCDEVGSFTIVYN